MGDGCLMEGISSEACSLAGHLGLDNLIVIYDSNRISIAGGTDLSFSENVEQRFLSQGWDVLEVDGHNLQEIDQVLNRVKSLNNAKPCLIIANTIIGKGSPNKADKSSSHGSPLGVEELQATKKALNWTAGDNFHIPEDVARLFAQRKEAICGDYEDWLSKFVGWEASNQPLAEQLSAQISLKLPDDFREQLLEVARSTSEGQATRKTSSAILQKAAALSSSVVGGSADLEPSTLTVINGSPSVTKEDFSGVNIHYGVREHAMGAIINGMAYAGGFLPFGSTFMCFADYMKPAIRLAALSELPSLFIFTHDSVFLGEDGPTHQPIEHLISLRSIPNLHVFRPANAVETAIAYSSALSRRDGPSALVLTRQGIPHVEFKDAEQVEKGGYEVLQTANKEPELVLVATGSEVPLAVDVGKAFSASRCVRVVSMPCIEQFTAQSDEYRDALIPPRTSTVVIEAGSQWGWGNIIRAEESKRLFITIDEFGMSAPCKSIAEKLGFTKEAILRRIENKFKG